MTASLPPNRQKELKECGLLLYPSDANQFANLTDLSNKDRYQVSCFASLDAIFDQIGPVLGNNKKILWVVNTVSRCQQLAKRFKEALCYHSRFTLDDRKDIHNNLITLFKITTHPFLPSPLRFVK